mmetsp:Transcript_33176/g.71649  ORF Transcript_33176/g.71649 Transcript_33176/m.71649 type:complete len:476 (-) Transcript_33176:72-1499(-)
MIHTTAAPTRSPTHTSLTARPLPPSVSSSLAAADARHQPGTLGLVIDSTRSVQSITPGGSAAWDGGIQVGDTLVSVGDVNVDGLSLTTLCQLLAGPAGSQVELTLQRTGSPYGVKLTRFPRKPETRTGTPPRSHLPPTLMQGVETPPMARDRASVETAQPLAMPPHLRDVTRESPPLGPQRGELERGERGGLSWKEARRMSTGSEEEVDDLSAALHRARRQVDSLKKELGSAMSRLSSTERDLESERRLRLSVEDENETQRRMLQDKDKELAQLRDKHNYQDAEIQELRRMVLNKTPQHTPMATSSPQQPPKHTPETLGPPFDSGPSPSDVEPSPPLPSHHQRRDETETHTRPAGVPSLALDKLAGRASGGKTTRRHRGEFTFHPAKCYCAANENYCNRDGHCWSCCGSSLEDSVCSFPNTHPTYWRHPKHEACVLRYEGMKPIFRDNSDILEIAPECFLDSPTSLSSSDVRHLV